MLSDICGHVLDLSTTEDNKRVRRAVNVSIGLAARVRVGPMVSQRERSEDG